MTISSFNGDGIIPFLDRVLIHLHLTSQRQTFDKEVDLFNVQISLHSTRTPLVSVVKLKYHENYKEVAKLIYIFFAKNLI